MNVNEIRASRETTKQRDLRLVFSSRVVRRYGGRDFLPVVVRRSRRHLRSHEFFPRRCTAGLLLVFGAGVLTASEIYPRLQR